VSFEVSKELNQLRRRRLRHPEDIGGRLLAQLRLSGIAQQDHGAHDADQSLPVSRQARVSVC
jgi:hypothetical protein